MFISLMTGQTETTEIKMNMRNINIITARSVSDKSVSDDFMNAVLSNCTTRIVLPALKEFGSESLPHNFNMAAVGVMKKGMSMSLFFFSGKYSGLRTTLCRKNKSDSRVNFCCCGE
ncbi:conjugal transfer protein TrbD [Klebsiella pneumoniae]|uniref:Conjugal transfer protein TrbD n=1 Tax=Klebsiella pneumoniae TaxID=573 RepID=A0A2X1QW04_KLEPN|nr:conjugal transfer protein TrbD [Klebsiella pneumoniae]